MADEQQPAVQTPEREVTPTVSSIEERITAAYLSLIQRPGDLASLARLRNLLPDIDRDDLDRELKALDRRRVILLDPDPNRKAIPPEGHEAAIKIGGEAKHLLSMPNPTTPTEQASTPQPTAQTAQPVPEQAAPVQGLRQATRPLIENQWGGRDGEVLFHPDGEIGQAIGRLGNDARLDVHGDALGNVLGRTATEAMRGQCTSQEAVDRIAGIRDQLPAGSHARQVLDQAVERLDAPRTPVPAVPASVPAPLRQLMADLHQVPLVRQDPKEQQALTAILESFAEGRTGGLRLISAVEMLHNRRHESKEGKTEIDRAVSRAVAGLEELARTHGRAALRLPDPNRAGDGNGAQP